MGFLEDIGGTNAVGNFAQNTMQNAVQLSEMKRRSAVDTESLKMQQEKHDIEMRRLQAEEQARIQQEKIRGTRINIETHPLFQSLPPEAQDNFRTQLNFIDPVDQESGTYSLGGIQDAIKATEADAEAYKALMSPVVNKVQQDMVATQKIVTDLEAKGKTDSKEYQEAKATLTDLQQRYMIANDKYAKHLMTLTEIDARAQAAQAAAAKDKNPLETMKKKVSLLKTELDSILSTHRLTQEEQGLIQALMVADPNDPQAFANAMASMNSQKTVYDGLPTPVKSRVDDILGQMKAISMGATGQKPGVRPGDIESIKAIL